MEWFAANKGRIKERTHVSLPLRIAGTGSTDQRVIFSILPGGVVIYPLKVTEKAPAHVVQFSPNCETVTVYLRVLSVPTTLSRSSLSLLSPTTPRTAKRPRKRARPSTGNTTGCHAAPSSTSSDSDSSEDKDSHRLRPSAGVLTRLSLGIGPLSPISCTVPTICIPCRDKDVEIASLRTEVAGLLRELGEQKRMHAAAVAARDTAASDQQRLAMEAVQQSAQMAASSGERHMERLENYLGASLEHIRSSHGAAASEEARRLAMILSATVAIASKTTVDMGSAAAPAAPPPLSQPPTQHSSALRRAVDGRTL